MRYVTVIAEVLDHSETYLKVYNSKSESVDIPLLDIEGLLDEDPCVGEEFVFLIPVDVAEKNGLYWE